MATFVLVHGATHGGWCWKWVAGRLRSAGHNVHMPSLTGAGDRVHLLDRSVGLDTHIQDVEQLITFEDLRDVVLVGHSSSGPVIQVVADRRADRIAQLVHFDSVVPLDGENALDQMAADRREGFQRIADERGDGWLLPIGRGVARHGIDDPALASWIDDRLVPQPLRCLTDRITLTGRHATVPTTYITCTRKIHPDPSVVPPWQRTPGWNVIELEAGQFAMITHAAETAAILIRIAEDLP